MRGLPTRFAATGRAVLTVDGLRATVFLFFGRETVRLESRRRPLSQTLVFFLGMEACSKASLSMSRVDGGFAFDPERHSAY